MTPEFFKNNREKLIREVLTQDHTALILLSGIPRRKTADEDYPFYANRNFVYITGLEQENLIYMAWRVGGIIRDILVLPPVDAFKTRWFGRMLTPEQAAERSGLSVIKDPASFEKMLPGIMGSLADPVIWMDFDPAAPNQPAEPAEVYGETLKKRYRNITLRNLHPVLAHMRTLKCPEEIASLEKSIAVTGNAIRAMLRAAKPGMYEYQLEAVFDHSLADQGCRKTCFDTIVAAGRNSLVMHYPEMDARLEDGDIILIDLGAQWDTHGADISRIFPANGHFTTRQKWLHDTSRDCIDHLCLKIKPGMPKIMIDRVQDAFLFERLKEMELLTSPEEVTRYRWHGVSHHLGMDCHDSCDGGMPLTPGMVVTMEVGIYVEAWGEGCRVEDNILITEDGCRNLSVEIPRTTQQIEAIMAGEE